MNTSQFSIKDTLESQTQRVRIGKEDSYVRKQTTIAGNKIILEMPDTSFLEGEKVTGTVMLDLRTKLNIKRINIQVIGELSYVIRESLSPSMTQNERTLTLNDVMKNYKRATSLSSVQRQRTSGFRQLPSYNRLPTYNRLPNHTETISSFTLDRKLFNASSSNKVFPEYQLAGLVTDLSSRSKTLKSSQTMRGVLNSIRPPSICPAIIFV